MRVLISLHYAVRILCCSDAMSDSYGFLYAGYERMKIVTFHRPQFLKISISR